MRFNFRICLLFMGGYLHFGASIAQTPKIDSLLAISTKQTSKADLAAVFEQVSKEFQSVNVDQAKEYAQKSLENARQSDNVDQLVRSFSSLIYTLLETRKLDSARAYIEEASELIEKIDDPRTLAAFYNHYGTYYFYRAELDNALSMYYKSIEYDEIIGDPALKMRSYGNLGIMLNNAGRKSDAINAYNTALKMAQELNDEGAKMRLLVNLASLYSYSKPPFLQLDTATILANEALQIAKSLQFEFGIARINALLASILIRNDQPQQGLEAAMNAGNYFRSANMLADYWLALLNEGFAYEAMGQPDKAIQIAKLLLEETAFSLHYECDRLLYLAYKKKKLSTLALEHLEKYKHTADSLSALEKDKDLAELQTKYEAGKKEAEIAQLNQESEIHRLELAQQKALTLGTIVALLLVIGFGWIYYVQSKVKQQRALSQMEQKALRSQMNPHFIFNALGAIQNYMLQNKPLEAGSYMSRFARLMRQILENSREDYISLDNEISTLENYLQLQSLRFDNKFKYEIKVDPLIDQEVLKIPPMLAQPFIENALEHGLSSIDKEGLIKISFSLENDRILLTVTDNGKGIANTVKLNPKHKSLATTIIQERIAVINKILKRKIIIHIENLTSADEFGTGTKVSLLLPYK